MNESDISSYSLTKRLLLFLIAPLLFILFFAGWLTANRVTTEINHLHDTYLSNSANVFTAFLQFQFSDDIDDDSEDEKDDDDEENGSLEIAEELLEAVAQIERQHGVFAAYRLSVSGRVIFTSTDVALLPRCGEGFNLLTHKASSQDSGEEWRCFGKSYSLMEENQQYDAEFFELVSERSSVIYTVLKSTLLPLIFVPILLLFIAWATIRQGMKEIYAVSKDVSSRSANNLDELSLNRKPEELLPILNSVNQLMHKVTNAIEREKQFTDDAAHELRTPITSISMTEQLLHRENKQTELQPLLGDLKKAVDQSQDTIEQLLRFARLQSQDELLLENQNINGLVKNQLDIQSSQILEKGLTLIFKQEAQITLPIDVAAMELAIANILNNAIKFTEQDGTIHLDLNNEYLSIEDDGVGIKCDQRQRVFDRFYRTPDSRNSPGTGLGLSLAKWVIDLHGFSVHCKSPNHLTGAAFIVYWR